MKIPYSCQTINGCDIKAVLNALKSPWLTQGPKLEKFEKALAKKVNSKYCVAVSNGTAALHLSYLALDLPSSSEVITTPITFAATSNAALYCGYRPVFVDINPVTINLDASLIEKKITKKTGVIASVCMAGLPPDLDKINAIARSYKLATILDAAHALGSRYQTKNGKWFNIGDGRLADMTIFSFHPVKNITTGEGGAITTNSRKYYLKLLKLRSHGMEKCGTAKRPYLYRMVDLGFNYRITDFQCALGIEQLKRLKEFVALRRAYVSRYNDSLSEYKEIRIPLESQGLYSAYHLYIVRVKAKQRDGLYRYLSKKKITSQIHYLPVPMHPYYQKIMNLNQKAIVKEFPEACRYYRECLSLPLFPSLGKKRQDRVISEIKKFYQRQHA